MDDSFSQSMIENLVDCFDRNEELEAKQANGFDDGTSLGLVVSRSILQMNGGSIRVETQHGRQLTLILTMQLQQEPHESLQLLEPS